MTSVMKKLKKSCFCTIVLLFLFSFDQCLGQSGKNWTEQIICNTATNAAKTCSSSNSVCLVAAKSVTGPKVTINSNTTDQLFQCRPSSPKKTIEADVNISGDDTDDTIRIDLSYAELWKCKDNAASDCTSELLTNVFALTRYWCQNKPSCSFNRNILLSYANNNNWKGNETQNDGQISSAVFEWQLSINDVSSNQIFTCPENSILQNGNCYKLTPRGKNWTEARRYCLDQGGDLARFTETTDFWSILTDLKAEIVNGESAKVWFKWYTWDGEQRAVQQFGEMVDSFVCEVKKNADGKNPLSQCFGGSLIPWVTGLCVLPPASNSSNFIYEATQCDYRCVDIFSNGTCYDWTETVDANTVAKQNCPDGYVGTAYWLCNSGNRWDTLNPDLSNCTKSEVSNVINDATNSLNENDSQTDVINQVNGKLNNITLISGDLLAVDRFIGKALEYQKKWLYSTEDSNIVKENKTKAFSTAMVDLFNITLNSTQAFWGLVPYPRFQLVDGIQLQVNEMQAILGGVLINGSYVSADDNLLRIQVEHYIKSSINNNTYSSSKDPKQTLTLPTGYQNDHNFTDNSYISFVDYSPFQNLLYGDTLKLMMASKTNTPENVTFPIEFPITSVLDTISIGAKLGNGSTTSFTKTKNVKITLVNKFGEYTYNMSNMKCVFWDHTIQFWNEENCTLQKVPNKRDTVSCYCDHLTNFAVIVDINGPFNGTYPHALDYITNIGTIISIVCLAVAFLIFCCVRSLWRDFRFHIHRNLCLSLLTAEIFMLVGLDATKNHEVCLSMAILQHFFFLSAFGWMLVEGIYLYFLITRVFDGTGFKRWQYYLIGLGLPVVVVSITMGIHFGVPNYDLYPNTIPESDFSAYCWLSPENGAIWAFLAPIAGVIIMNSFFLIVAIWTSLKSKRRRSSMSSDQDKMNCQWVFGALSLTFVLGITWIFGFFFFNNDGTDYVMAYIFTTLNSFQGVMIFLTVCIFNQKVRNTTLKELQRSYAYQRMFHSKSDNGSGAKKSKTSSQQSFGIVQRDNSFNSSDFSNSSSNSGVDVRNNYSNASARNYNNRF